MLIPNVVGVGIGLQKVNGQPTGQVGLVMMVSHKVPPELLAPEHAIPKQINGGSGGGRGGGARKLGRCLHTVAALAPHSARTL